MITGYQCLLNLFSGNKGANWHTASQCFCTGHHIRHHTVLLPCEHVSGSSHTTLNLIKNQDQVVTTGSTLYPRGLLLGYITNASLDETGVAKYATLDPSCDLGTLEQVFIITEYTTEAVASSGTSAASSGTAGETTAATEPTAPSGEVSVEAETTPDGGFG